MKFYMGPCMANTHALKQAEKLKSPEMKEEWMKKDEGWWFQADFKGFADRWKNGQTSRHL